MQGEVVAALETSMCDPGSAAATDPDEDKEVWLVCPRTVIYMIMLLGAWKNMMSLIGVLQDESVVLGWIPPL